jgi:uncharacterized phage-associated protein
MASVFDVATYILEVRGEMSAMKLQKLVYYSQAWHIAWTDEALFNERIEAWADGPVSPDLWQLHRGAFRVASLGRGRSDRLTDDQRDSIDKVVAFYGDKSPQWLSDLTHEEDPWRLARKGLPDRAPSNAEITHKAMSDYYAAL